MKECKFKVEYRLYGWKEEETRTLNYVDSYYYGLNSKHKGQIPQIITLVFMVKRDNGRWYEIERIDDMNMVSYLNITLNDCYVEEEDV